MTMGMPSKMQANVGRGPNLVPPISSSMDLSPTNPESELYLGDDGTVSFKRNSLHPATGTYVNNPHVSSTNKGKYLEQY